MTAQEVVRRLHQDGWREVNQTGSHKKFNHDDKAGTVIVPMHRGDIPTGTLRSIFRQAGWEKQP